MENKCWHPINSAICGTRWRWCRRIGRRASRPRLRRRCFCIAGVVRAAPANGGDGRRRSGCHRWRRGGTMAWHDVASWADRYPPVASLNWAGPRRRCLCRYSDLREATDLPFPTVDRIRWTGTCLVETRSIRPTLHDFYKSRLFPWRKIIRTRHADGIVHEERGYHWIDRLDPSDGLGINWWTEAAIFLLVVLFKRLAGRSAWRSIERPASNNRHEG